MSVTVASGAKRGRVRLAEQVLKGELARYEEMLDAALRQQKGYLSETEEAMYRSGKRLRPIMLLLSAGVARPDPATPIHDKVIQASVSLEMMHVATLIHDDIIDRAPIRRGLPSVKAARGTEMAVLIGDLQFLQSIRGLLDSVVVQDDLVIVDKVLKAGYEICLGEIDELHVGSQSAYDDLLELECRYMNIIDRKTAVLFGVACEAGAALMGARSRDVLALSRFGRRFGQAFQIMDDVRDFMETAGVSGKQPHIDLIQKRLSLPIINALKTLPPDNPLRSFLTRPRDDGAGLEEAVAAVTRAPGFAQTYAKARALMIEATAELGRFPQSPHRRALEEIAYATIDS